MAPIVYSRKGLQCYTTAYHSIIFSDFVIFKPENLLSVNGEAVYIKIKIELNPATSLINGNHTKLLVVPLFRLILCWPDRSTSSEH